MKLKKYAEGEDIVALKTSIVWDILFHLKAKKDNEVPQHSWQNTLWKEDWVV